jgi:hypothetical protein
VLTLTSDRIGAITHFLGEERGPGRVAVEQKRQLPVEVADLFGKEPDPCSDRAQRDHGGAVLAGRAGRYLQMVDAGELLDQRAWRSPARRCSGATAGLDSAQRALRSDKCNSAHDGPSKPRVPLRYHCR